MRPSLVFRASQARVPMIKFLGKRTTPKSVDHSPQPHPASPTHQLPESFASYRQKAQQHGPLGGGPASGSESGNAGGSSSSPRSSASNMGGPMTYGAVGGRAGRDLGSIKPKEGEYFDISELPKRFQRRQYTDQEMDAVTSGGASLW